MSIERACARHTRDDRATRFLIRSVTCSCGNSERPNAGCTHHHPAQIGRDQSRATHWSDRGPRGHPLPRRWCYLTSLPTRCTPAASGGAAGSSYMLFRPVARQSHSGRTSGTQRAPRATPTSDTTSADLTPDADSFSDEIHARTALPASSERSRDAPETFG